MDEDRNWEVFIKSNLTSLTKSTVIGTELVISLYAMGLITDEEKDLLLNTFTPNIKRTAMLYTSIARKWSDSNFKDFKTILKETGNSRALEIFTQASDVSGNLPTKVPQKTKKEINFHKASLQLLSEIGSGDFGKVWLVKDVNRNSEQFAVKQIHLPEVAKHFSLKRIKKEATTLRELQHENIVPYIDDWFGGPNSKLYEDNSNTKINLGVRDSSSGAFTEIPLDYFFIQMKYFPNNLKSFLASHESQKSRAIIRPKLYKIFQQTLTGLKYIHSKRILHRDIKPANILMSESPDLHVVWGDFGLAIDEDSTMSINGNTTYRAPELEHTKAHTEATDVFSLGLIFRECLQYFPDRIDRDSVFEAYNHSSKNLEDILRTTFDSQALSELEWQLIHQITQPFKGSRINTTSALEWIKQFVLCDNPSEIIWNDHTRGMVAVPSPFWINVPAPVESFVGRQDQINELANIWKHQNSAVVQISGFTGIGVSQLLYKFLELIRGFSHCIFLNATTIETIQQSLHESLQLTSNLETSLSTIEQLKLSIERLSPSLSSLIVVLHQCSNSQKELLEVISYLKDVSPRMIIVTSTNNYILDRYHPTKLEVPPLTQEESVQLLCRRVNNLPTSDAHLPKLASLLGCVPHVLNSIAEYLQAVPASNLLQVIQELCKKLEGSDETVYQEVIKESSRLADNWAGNLQKALGQWFSKSELKYNPQVAQQFAESFVLVLAFIHPSTIYYTHFPTYMQHVVDLHPNNLSGNVTKFVKCLVNNHICTCKGNSLSINAAIQRCIRLRLKDPLSKYMTILTKVLDERILQENTIVNAALFWKRFVIPNPRLTKTHIELGVRLATSLFNVSCYAHMEKHLKCIVNYFIECPPESETEVIYLTRSKVMFAIALVLCNKEDAVNNVIEGLTIDSVEAAFADFVASKTLRFYISTIENKISYA